MQSKAMRVDRRRIIGAAGVTAIALGMAGRQVVQFAPPVGESPIMTLFREWEATYHAASDTPDDVCDALMDRCREIEAQMMQIPSIQASEVAAKWIVATGYGDFMFLRSSPLFDEALALAGSRGAVQS